MVRVDGPMASYSTQKWTRMVMVRVKGQHGHGRILINDAAKQQNPTSYRGYFFLKVAIDRGPHPKAQPAALYCSLATWAMLG